MLIRVHDKMQNQLFNPKDVEESIIPIKRLGSGRLTVTLTEGFDIDFIRDSWRAQGNLAPSEKRPGANQTFERHWNGSIKARMRVQRSLRVHPSGRLRGILFHHQLGHRTVCQRIRKNHRSRMLNQYSGTTAFRGDPPYLKDAERSLCMRADTQNAEVL